MDKEWLMTLLGGLGGAFTGVGAARERRATEAEREAQARLRDQQAQMTNAIQGAQLENQLGQLGYRRAAPPSPITTTPGIGPAGVVPTQRLADMASRQGEVRKTPIGEFQLDRRFTPDAKEARAILEARRAAEAKAQPGTGGMTPMQMTQAGDDLAKLYDADPIVKMSKDVALSYGRVLSTDDNAAGDLSLIFAYMKMLDPGSVVREGEFANAQNAAGVDDRVKNLYNRLLTGERLTPDQRSQFRGQARGLARQQQRHLRDVQKRYTQRAAPYNVNATLLFSNPFDLFNLFDDDGRDGSGAGSSAGADMVRNARRGNP